MLRFNSITGAAMLLLGSVAFAQQVGDTSTAGTGLTRAEVKAELARSIASGEFAAWRELAGEGTAATSAPRAAGAQGRPFAGPGLTRAEVMAEFARARASGELERYQALLGGGH